MVNAQDKANAALLIAEADRLERLADEMAADSTRHCGGTAEKLRGLKQAHLVRMEAQGLREKAERLTS
ncbi:hypothetical protein [Methylobacterium bullatum]|jgi:hypothetical protein|uniref:DUF465 domain-containing protein n=1 Tax=Methylobacterium bullatum TaxID=570505 RepID=A0AAV4ZB93_9HYPH|nr:hypothetical protein [Methylobacterium bullatum]GJD41286.1 hypothetical protein OICFNHDK_3769 [Methylobacterium bullatum]